MQYNFTAREEALLRLVAIGKKNDEMATILGIGVSTVLKLRRDIIARTHSVSVNQALLRSGLVDNQGTAHVKIVEGMKRGTHSNVGILSKDNLSEFIKKLAELGSAGPELRGQMEPQVGPTLIKLKMWAGRHYNMCPAQITIASTGIANDECSCGFGRRQEVLAQYTKLMKEKYPNAFTNCTH